MLEVNVGTSCEIRGLLEEDRIGSENLAHIYRDLLGGKSGMWGWLVVGCTHQLLGGENRVHDWNVGVRCVR